MSRSIGALALVCLLGSQGAAAAADRILTSDRLGPVRLGMTLTQAQRALGAALRPEQAEHEEACWYGSRADGRDPAISYMIEHGKVTRIHISGPVQPRVPAVSTAKGAGLGMTLAELQARYGPALSVGPHPIAPHARWAIVRGPGPGAIRFSLSDDRVIEFWNGLPGAIDYPEGCS